jgi:hypothetical protein
MLLTYSMEHSPSWEANQSLQLVKKFFPAFLWNLKVLYRTHKCPPPVPILSQLHPVPTTPSNFLKIHLNILLPSTSGSPQWPLSLRFPHQHPVHTSFLPHTRHMPHPSHSSDFTTSHVTRRYIKFILPYVRISQLYEQSTAWILWLLSVMT